MAITLKFMGCLSIFPYIYILVLFSCDARIDDYSYVKVNFFLIKIIKTKLLNK